MSTFYAAFPDVIKAQLMARVLLDDGLEVDDISVIARTGETIEAAAEPSIGDASFFVGRPDDPTHGLVDTEARDADYEAVEVSPVGGGISTSDEGENVEMVDQMDESQEVADEQTWPQDDTSFSRHELDDLDRAVMTGFPTPVTPIDNEVEAETEPDRPLQSVSVPGIGVVIGGGDLATAALDWNANGRTDASGFLTYLQDEGVPPLTANRFFAEYRSGGAVLAVGLGPQIDEQALEGVAQEYGAVESGWFGAPRY